MREGRRTRRRLTASSRSSPRQVQRYLAYQGTKFLSRFDANSFVALTKLMDTHDMGRGRKGGVAGALGDMNQPALIVSIDSDVLYPPYEQMELHQLLPNSQFESIRNDDGHDGFLLAQEEIGPILGDFLDKNAGVINFGNHAFSPSDAEERDEPSDGRSRL